MKLEIDEMELQKTTMQKMVAACLPATQKIDQLLSLIPDNIWFTKLVLSPEAPPKSTKDQPKPAAMAFTCQVVDNPYGNISEFRKNLQGQIGKNLENERRDKILEFSKDVLLPLPSIDGFTRVSVGSKSKGSSEGFEWIQKVNFKLRGTYESAKK